MPPSKDVTRRILLRHVEESHSMAEYTTALQLMFPSGWSLVWSQRSGLYALSGIATPQAEPVQAHGGTSREALSLITSRFMERYLS